MKKITLTSDEWQACVEALNMSANYAGERLRESTTHKLTTASKTWFDLGNRYRAVRDKIVEQTQERGDK